MERLQSLFKPWSLFLIYIFTNMVPTLLLVGSEPFNIWGKAALFFLPLGLYLILFSLHKNTALIELIFIPLLIIHAFQLVLFYLYGEDVIAVDMFLNLVTTNPTEAGELLKSIRPSIIYVCLLYIPVIVLAIYQLRSKQYLGKKFRGKAIIVGAISLLLSIISLQPAKNINMGLFSTVNNIYPINVFYNLKLAINKWNKNLNFPVTSEEFTFNAHKEQIAERREIYILVIGETSRAENWSLYGYERETTPKLEKSANLICYKDVLTQSNTTHKSVSIILSAASAESYETIYSQKSILTAFKECGFTTIFLSNQGNNHSLIEKFAREADIYTNIRSQDRFITTVNTLDGELLPLLEESIDSTPGDLFIVLHMYGSHFNYRERYPKKFSIYTPDSIVDNREREILVNAYDNTILYTDYFLSEIIRILEEREECASLLFASDHGEDILDDKRGRFLHASPNPTFYQLRIPMVMWFSDSYISEFPIKAHLAYQHRKIPVTTEVIFHTLIDIASIRTEYMQPSLSTVNSIFKRTKRLYLNDHDKAIFYYNANLKKEDKIMIKKRGVDHSNF